MRTAPFYVLIGANMPSILAEIAFVSNPEDEKLLRTPEHRERIAESLLRRRARLPRRAEPHPGAPVDRLRPRVYSGFRRADADDSRSALPRPSPGSRSRSRSSTSSGVVLSSLGLAGICAVVALVLGIALGVVFIVRRRRQAPVVVGGRSRLHLAAPGEPPRADRPAVLTRCVSPS